MTSIHFVNLEFKQSLNKVFSDRECDLIWNQWVIKELLNISLVDYLLDGDFLITKSQLKRIYLLIKHLSNNQPIQYFFGYVYFKKLKIGVNNNVLIPRPETEELVDIVLKSIAQNKIKPNNILDIGTGSGCISIALKKNTEIDVSAIDVCEKALTKAKENAKKLNTEIDFHLFDVLSNQENHISNFDIIVSNPPYVLPSEVSEDSNIHAEPSSAIFVTKDKPLIFYDAIFLFAIKKLNPGGRIFLEINPLYISELLLLLNKYNYSEIKIHNDFSGKKRFIVVTS